MAPTTCAARCQAQVQVSWMASDMGQCARAVSATAHAPLCETGPTGESGRATQSRTPVTECVGPRSVEDCVRQRAAQPQTGRRSMKQEGTSGQPAANTKCKRHRPETAAGEE
eukprot:TRINITY_DN43054_c0_g1_i2.p4 TRINITY_DN43054_c0_g1~~TRINITY_DN43054_c0_g1_i2.p4  ORF type:complete len:112 (-),score=3.70 TRINITY_DN43054_c0_g1_i2:25-360(-)